MQLSYVPEKIARSIDCMADFVNDNLHILWSVSGSLILNLRDWHIENTRLYFGKLNISCLKVSCV